MPKVKETVLQLDLTALEHNYRHLRSKLDHGVKFMAVVKAFAYGSDAQKVALHLQSLGAEYFAVAYTKEGVALREAGVTRPIMVLHPQELHLEDIVDHCLEPSLYSHHILSAFLKMAGEKGFKDYPIHLKFNTGLNRLGFCERDTVHLLEMARQNPAVRVASVLSHLAATEDPAEREFTLQQIHRFHNIQKRMTEALPAPCMAHLLNTSGILNYPQAQYSMVRSGIGLYGYGNGADEDLQMRPVATLKTIVAQVHHLEAGESVGYNRAYTSSEKRTTATLPLGHADGIARIYGHGRGQVMVNGQKAPIVGNVCMDMLMVDVTGIPCKEGDEVLVFGPGHTAAAFAEGAGTISYELLTGISQRVARQYHYGPQDADP
ncbi:alanine racemase [Maribacter sp. 2307ULW6-5]|uniref:alanine racemase n=1 Tax=Maribacter sp. 2307ULW6-5 TaxID=3386275 RepID=UPI0039BC4C95